LYKAPAGGAPFVSPDLEKADVAATAKSGYVIDVNDNADATNRDVLAAANTCNVSAAASRAMFHVVGDRSPADRRARARFASDHRGTIYFQQHRVSRQPDSGGARGLHPVGNVYLSDDRCCDW
jgi:hypothetical protein